MAEKKISQLTAKGAALAQTDLLVISEDAGGGVYNTKSVTGANIKALVTDANMTTTDITTNNVSTSKHGFAPKAPNDTTKFLRGDGTWAVPAGGGSSSGKFGIADSTGAYTYYTTLGAAITASTAGQTIEVFTDYTETGAVTITLKDGVTINGNGHTYILSIANNTNHTFLIDSSGTYKILNLNIKRTNGGASVNTLRITAGNSFIYGDGSYFYNTNSSAIVSIPSSNELYNLYGSTDDASSYSIYSESKVYNSIGKGTGIGIGSYNGHIYNSIGISSGSYGLEICESSNCTGISSSSSGIRVVSGGSKTLSNCIGYSSSGAGIGSVTNGIIFNNCNAYSSASYGFAIGASTSINNCTSYSSSNWGIYIPGGKINNSYVFSSTNYGVYTESNVIISNSTIESSSTSCVYFGSGTSNAAEIHNCTLITGNSAAYCLLPQGAYTIKYSSNIFKGATTPVNANITQGMTNTEDTYGNITI